MRPKTFGSIGGCKERCGDAKSGASKVGNVESELMEDIDQLFTYAYLHNINLPGNKNWTNILCGSINTILD